MTIALKILSVLISLFPLLAYLAGLSFPEMRQNVGQGTIPSGHLLVFVLATSAWWGLQFGFSVWRNTPVSALIIDSLLGAAFAIGFGWMAGNAYGTGTLNWAILIAFVAAVVDTAISIAASINNAAQKPLMGGRASV